ncbi:hypothetical protein CBW65_14515 [Tumebacillus avium]|uniref:DUF3231 domain-containing protein n=1 Tax=Tumebacillus avium TaxID=1903704 RepID=A0A1Y0IQG9_9BACL|nr:DUF3231 family protein [Tumebacillus avium]ARU62086.1 hypothetical protein CBW65_14515 [Tumebacillus avium]
MGILSGNPQHEPLHYGEVYSLWTFVSGNQSKIACYQAYLNHAGDGDLRNLIADKINECKDEVAQVGEVLKLNGVALPPAPAEKPAADLESIPPGARFTDPEIAMALSVDTGAGLVMCSKIMAQSIREDIGAMFGKFHVKAAAYGLHLLRMQKEKGWLVPPPLHLSKDPE